MSDNPNVTNVPVDDDPLVQLITDLGVTCQYRQYYIAAGESGGSLTAGTNVKQPIGTHDASFDPTEHAATDSTVDAGTGFTPPYAPAVSVRAYFPPPVVFSIAGIGPVGLGLQETQDYVYLLATSVTPSRGDLIDHPNGTQWVIGQEQRAVGLSDRPAAWACAVEHRAANSVTAGY